MLVKMNKMKQITVTVHLPVVRVKGVGGVLSAAPPAIDRNRPRTDHGPSQDTLSIYSDTHIHVLMHTHALIRSREPHKIKNAPKLFILMMGSFKIYLLNRI